MNGGCPADLARPLPAKRAREYLEGESVPPPGDIRMRKMP